MPIAHVLKRHCLLEHAKLLRATLTVWTTRKEKDKIRMIPYRLTSQLTVLQKKRLTSHTIYGPHRFDHRGSADIHMYNLLSSYDTAYLVSDFHVHSLTQLSISLGCGHSYCHIDVIQLLLSENVGRRSKVQCPTCRTSISSRPAINWALKSIIEEWIKTKDDNYNFEEWQSDRGYNIICSFFTQLP